jgi:SAM-dependent methyltransferase
MNIDVNSVHPSNAEQAGAWNGDEGRFWAEHATRFDAAVARYQPVFLEAGAVQHADHVLDIGCGAGGTTRAAAQRATNGYALGVDLSAGMIALARELAQRDQIVNARFACADAQIEPFETGAFDVAISRTGAMFFGRPEEAFANIARAVRPGGRLVLMTWQPFERNEWLPALATALSGRAPTAPPADTPGPFSLSSPDRVRALLGSSGFEQVELDGLVEPMCFGRDPDDAFEFVIGLFGWMLRGLDDDAAQAARRRLHAALQRHATPEGVLLSSAAWIVTARRR